MNIASDVTAIAGRIAGSNLDLIEVYGHVFGGFNSGSNVKIEVAQPYRDSNGVTRVSYILLTSDINIDQFGFFFHAFAAGAEVISEYPVYPHRRNEYTLLVSVVGSSNKKQVVSTRRSLNFEFGTRPDGTYLRPGMLVEFNLGQGGAGATIV